VAASLPSRHAHKALVVELFYNNFLQHTMPNCGLKMLLRLPPMGPAEQGTPETPLAALPLLTQHTVRVSLKDTNVNEMFYTGTTSRFQEHVCIYYIWPRRRQMVTS
jgi:hypothetical protein